MGSLVGAVIANVSVMIIDGRSDGMIVSLNANVAKRSLPRIGTLTFKVIESFHAVLDAIKHPERANIH